MSDEPTLPDWRTRRDHAIASGVRRALADLPKSIVCREDGEHWRCRGESSGTGCLCDCHDPDAPGDRGDTQPDVAAEAEVSRLSHELLLASKRAGEFQGALDKLQDEFDAYRDADEGHAGGIVMQSIRNRERADAAEAKLARIRQLTAEYREAAHHGSSPTAGRFAIWVQEALDGEEASDG